MFVSYQHLFSDLHEMIYELLVKPDCYWEHLGIDVAPTTVIQPLINYEIYINRVNSNI